jgi:uncharacterized SAM-binding protein YcdF (DUF218 family)
MVTNANGGRGAFLIQTNLFENRIPAEGIWTTGGGIQLQQRYDKSRPDQGRPSPQRRYKNLGIPDRGNTPQPLPLQDVAAGV